MRKIGLVCLACLGWWAMSIGGAAAGSSDLMFIVKELKIPADCSLPIAYGMNNKGDVVGQVTAPESIIRAVLWAKDQEEATLLPLLAGYDISYAYSINDAGQIAGYCVSYSGQPYRACLWQNGAVQALPYPPDFSSDSYAFRINNNGQVAGSAYKRYFDNLDHGVFWGEGDPVDMGVINNNSVTPQGLGNNGVVSGYYGPSPFQAFQWTSGGGFRDLAVPGGASKIFNSNALGQSVGWFMLPGETSLTPCRWDTQGNRTPLSPLTLGSGKAINDLGEVVGHANNYALAFLWENGQVTDLNRAVSVSSGWIISEPWAINNGIQIVASGYRADDPSQTKRPLLLNPVTKSAQFRLTDLGKDAIPKGINRSGEMVGKIGNQACYWQGSKVQWLGPEGSVAMAISGAGMIVGWANIDGTNKAVSWNRQGQMTVLDQSESQALGVNNAGVVAGAAKNAENTLSPCLWKPGEPRLFLVPGQYGTAYGVNDGNSVVGDVNRPFRWTESGGLEYLEGDTGKANAVNNVEGAAGITAGRPCFWRDRKLYFLSDNTQLRGEAHGLNFLDQLTGYYINDETDLECAFLYDRSDLSMVDLNTRLRPLRPDWQLRRGYGITMGMEIIGIGRFNGETHGFLLQRVGTSVIEALIPLLF